MMKTVCRTMSYLVYSVVALGGMHLIPVSVEGNIPSQSADADLLFSDQPVPDQWIQQTGAMSMSAAAAAPCSPFDREIACDGPDAPSAGWFSDLSTRKTLTDGLWGAQAELADQGIGYQSSLTQFYQGVASGGRQEQFRYGGKVDQFITLDGQKLGLWHGLMVSVHAETRFGQDTNLIAAGLAPSNANMLYPNDESTTAITGLLINQFLSEEWMVSAGTYNQLDLFAMIYPQTGRGVDGFMNMSAIAPLSLSRPLNLSMLGAGITKLNEGRVQGALSVFNTANATTNSTFNELFDNGAVVMGYYRIFTNFADLPGSHALLGVYSSGTYTSVDPTTWVILPSVGVVAGQQTGTWNLTYFYEKKLWVDAQDSQRNVGLLTSWGLSDGNPNPISWAGNITLQGNGLVSGRPADSLGVAYFHTALSGDFERLLRPVMSVNDVDGVELYYNAAVFPWFHLTGDFQVINPANTANDPAIVVGLRGKIDL